MTAWIVTCPTCGAKNEMSRSEVEVACGKVTCTCTCRQCDHVFTTQEEYWRWLGLEEAPPVEV